MFKIKSIRLLLLLLIMLTAHTSQAQLYYLTKDILENTRYIRKKQTIHTIRDASYKDGLLLVNFTATPDRKNRRRPYHIALPVDSLLAYYHTRPYYFYRFDSAAAQRLKVNSVERRYTNITRRNIAAGVDVMCPKEILEPGFVEIKDPSQQHDTLEILNGKEHPYEYDHKTRLYLKGQHPVFIFYFNNAPMSVGQPIDYLVINIENSPQINKLNYLKLPLALIADTVMFPFALMVSGMEK